ncbi:MAG: alpha/beta hydrolase, partial [Acidobacteria bacterium]|nr:alpha/beta hydrolase [Acidobacteriota bacterium]
MISMTQRPLPVYDHQIGEGPTLVFLHYWGGSSRTWQLVVDELPGRDIITVDFRGWSRSEGMSGPYTLQQYAADVVAVLTDAGAEDYVLVGHSMGGKVAQLIAATRPQGLRGMVLVASGPARPAEAITQEYRNSLSHAYDSEESVIGVRDAVLTATALSDALKAQIVADSMSSSLEARMEWPLHGIAEDITDKARLVSVPAIVVAGADDPVEPVGVLR